MQVETIEKYVENKERANSFITISFKDRNNIKGKFIRQADYEELKSKNLWRIVTANHFDNWAVFWGPGVIVKRSGIILPLQHKADYFVSAVSMTIFQNKSTNTFVLAIQATNPNCTYAWKTLDFSVNKTVAWKKGIPAHGVISNGTSIGLTYLTSLKDLQGTTGISEMLSGCNDSTNIIVTGHSLGGALSPALALYLQNNTVGKSINSRIYCLSTAGATPGDSLFAKYYDSVLQTHTVRIWNNFDIIPHAWNPSNLSLIQSNNGSGGIYSLQGGSVFYDSTYLHCNPLAKQPTPFYPMVTPPYINALVDFAKKRASKTSYTPICNGGQFFMGAAANTQTTNYYIDVAHDTSENYLLTLLHIITKGKVAKVVDSAFLPEMAAQHVEAYSYEFQMKQIHEYLKHQIEINPQSLVNICGLKNDFDSGFKNLAEQAIANKTDIDPYTLLNVAIYRRAWRL